MIRVILWKEWRQQSAIVVAIFALAAITVAVTAAAMPGPWERRALEPSGGTVWYLILIVLAIAQAVISGALLFAGETEDHTQEFLDIYAPSRRIVWGGKLVSGLTLTACTAAVMCAAILLLSVGGALAVVSCATLALSAFLMSSACSTLCKSTIAAVGLSTVVILFAGYLTPVVVLAYSRGDSNPVNPTRWSIISIATTAIVVLGSVALSRVRYCKLDALRGRVEVRMPKSNIFRAALWQLWHQGKIWLGVLAAGFIGLGFAAASKDNKTDLLFVWPIATFLLGALAGWLVFADEQSSETAKFLGEQRVPTIRMWLAKVVPLCVIAVGATALCLKTSIAIRASGRESEHYVIATYLNTFQRSPRFLFVAYGFACAALAAQQCRKAVIGAFMTLALGGLSAALWTPSLLIGMSPWPFLMSSLLILGTTLLLWRRWTSERLHDWKGLGILGSIILVAAAWLAGNLWWRVAGVPDVGEPFDVAAFRRELAEAPDVHGAQIRDALAKFHERMTRADVEFTGHDKDNPEPWWDNPTPIDAASWGRFRWSAIVNGLPKSGGKWEQYVDFIFAGDWVKEFETGAAGAPDRLQSLIAWQEPRNWSSGLPGEMDEALRLYFIRAQLRMRDGKPLEALADLETALAAIRHCLHRSIGRIADIAVAQEAMGFYVADKFLQSRPGDTPFQRRLGEILAKHEESRPSGEGIVKSTYVWMQNLRDKKSGDGAGDWVLTHVPWEHERMNRLVRHAYRWWIEFVRSGAPLRDNPEANTRYDYHYSMWGIQFVDDYQELEFMQRTGGYQLDYLWSVLYHAEVNLTHLRGLRLTVAAALFESETGRPLASLEELVPKYLPKIPASPIGDRKYHLSRAQGGEPNFHGDEPPAEPGAGLITGHCQARYPSYFFIPRAGKK